MSKEESFIKKVIPAGTGCSLSTSVDDRCNQCAEASRFHRFYMALCSILAVLLNEPIYLYPVVVSILMLVIFSSRYEPSMLFYKHVLLKITGRHPWPIPEDIAGRYLVGRIAEKVNCASVGMIILLGLVLEALGFSLWVVPVAIVAAGISLAATTGVCLLGILVAKIGKFFPSILESHEETT